MRPHLPVAGRARRGMGTLLVVAALFIAVLACMQIAQSFLLTQVSDQTTRSTVGRICSLLAESVLEEARLVVPRRVNTPGDALFSRVRKGGGANKKPEVVGSVSLRLADLPQSRELFTSGSGKGYELVEPVECQLSYATSTSILMPVEYEGTATYHARVVWRSDRSIVREIEETQSFKVSHLVLPPPLSRYPLVVMNPAPTVLGQPRADGETWVNVNKVASMLTGEWIGGLRSKYREALDKFDEAEKKASGSIGFIRRVKPLYTRLENDSGLNHFQEIERLKGLFTAFPPIAADRPYSFLCVTASADLVNLNLQKQLRSRSLSFQTLAAQGDEAGRDVRARFDANDSSEAAYQANVRLTDLMLEECRLAEQMLAYVSYFQQCVKSYQRSSDQAGYDNLRAIHSLLDPAQMGEVFNAFVTRAAFRINEGRKGAPGYVPLNDQWKLLRERMGREPGMFGTVYVDNTDETLLLSEPIRGSVVIAVRGPVVIEGLRPADDRDFLTVVVNGGSRDRVAVKGQVRASIVARGKALAIDPGAQIQGTLFVDEISNDRLELFSGSVVPDPRAGDAAFGEPFFHVGFSPWVRSRTTTRS